jgi:hypothetical protein
LLTTAAGCSSGGTQVGTPVTAAPGSVANTATATSAAFAPAAAGTWCFRAEYPGDSNYARSSDGTPDECFTVVGPPSATIVSPAGHAVLGAGVTERANYSCAEASGGPGIASCTGTVLNGSPIDTSRLGSHAFAVTATSKDGLSTTASAQYTVAAPPAVAIITPRDGATYTRDESVAMKFLCNEGQFGTGLATCSGPSSVTTSRTGTFPFTVAATSADGLSSSQTVHYKVALPSNRFVISGLRSRRDGRITFHIRIPSAGVVSVLEMAPDRALTRPTRGEFVFARVRVSPDSPGRHEVVVRPDARGRFLVHHHRLPVRIHLLVTYTPAGGIPRRASFDGLRVTR